MSDSNESLSLAKKWVEVSPENFDAQQKLFEAGVDLIQEHMVLPEDNRFELAYATLVSGKGQKASIQAIGRFGTGKTTLGDLMFGEDARVEIGKHDSDETLFGYESAFKEKTVAGSMRALTPDDPRAYLNEVSHLRNTGPLNKLWDGRTLNVNGSLVDLENIAIYLTTNFPDANRVFEQDGSLRSRIAGEILTGDLSKAKSRKIQTGNTGEDSPSGYGPILPPAAIRSSIHEAVTARYPVSKSEADALGDYVYDLLAALGKTGLVYPVDPDDGRIGESFRQIARANLFLKGAEPGRGKVDFRSYSDIASIVLPTVVRLNHTGRAKLKEVAERSANSYEQAVAVRRLIARTTFSVLADRENAANPDTFARKGMEAHSYASLEKVDFDMDKALFDDKVAADVRGEAEEAEGESRRGLFGRFKSSRKA